MARNILFITSDQQRYDSLGCNGGTVARTPVIDALASLNPPIPVSDTSSSSNLQFLSVA